MKKYICLLLTAALLLLLTACGSDSTANKNTVSSTKSVNDVLNDQISASDSGTENSGKTENAASDSNADSSGGTEIAGSDSDTADAVVTATAGKDSIDVDLTTLSSTLVYSEVYNMMVDPESYVGKVIKMTGPFSVFTNEDQSQYYTAVIIEDATACCAQGLEFVWDAHDYPDDFPELGTEITVTGVFETYDEDGYLYCHLVSDDVSIG